MRRFMALFVTFALGAAAGAGGMHAWRRGQEPPLAHLAAEKPAADSADAAVRSDSAADALDSLVTVAEPPAGAAPADSLAPALPDSAAAVFDSLAAAVPALAGSRPLTPRRIAKVFGAMQPRDAAAVLGRLGDGQVQLVLGMLGDRQVAAILTALGPDRAAAISNAVIPAGGNVR